MAEFTDLENTLTVLSKLLLRCFFLGFFFLIFWFVLYMAVNDFMFNMHAGMFDVTRHDFDMMNYCGMAFFKLTVFVLFLIPYVSVRLVLRGINNPEGVS